MLALTARSGHQILLPAHSLQEILPGENQETQIRMPDGTTFPVQESPEEVRRQRRQNQVLELD